MESTTYHPLFQVTQKEIKAIRQSYNLDVQKINENLDIIEEWFKKEEHLADALPYIKRDMLERFHILGKGSIEKTKALIDKVLTVRGMIPEFFDYNMHTIFDEFDKFLDNMFIAPMPKINCKDCTRIFLLQIINENFEDFNVVEVARFSCFLIQMRMHYEYTFAHHLIINLKNVRANILTKLNPIVMKKIEVVFTDSYKARVKGIHFINAPSFVNRIVGVFNLVLKEKLAKRIHVHSTYEDLYQHISREVLPKDFGGDEMSCHDLAKHLKDFVKSESGRRVIEDSSKIVANENKRSSIKFNEEYMGMPGSFKQLNVD